MYSCPPALVSLTLYFLRLLLPRSSMIVSCRTNGYSGHISLHVLPEFSIEFTLFLESLSLDFRNLIILVSSNLCTICLLAPSPNHYSFELLRAWSCTLITCLCSLSCCCHFPPRILNIIYMLRILKLMFYILKTKIIQPKLEVTPPFFPSDNNIQLSDA